MDIVHQIGVRDEFFKVCYRRVFDGEIIFQQMDFDKISQYFNWNPKIQLDKGIKITAEWYKKYFTGNKKT